MSAIITNKTFFVVNFALETFRKSYTLLTMVPGKTKSPSSEGDFVNGFCLELLPLALYGDGVDLDVEHNETPELVELAVHPELF